MISSSLSSHFTKAKLSCFRLLCNCKVKRWESGAETDLCPAVSWCTLQWTLSLHYPSPPLPPSAPSTSFSHPLSSSPLSSSSLCSQGCRRGEWTWRRAETNIKKVLTPLSWLTSGCSSSWNTTDRDLLWPSVGLMSHQINDEGQWKSNLPLTAELLL